MSLRTYCHATEDPSKVKQALKFLLPGGKLAERKTTGHHGNPIMVYEVRVDKSSEAREFWKRMMESMTQDEMLENLDTMVDDDCVLHARLDKQKAFLGKIELVKHEDVIAVSSKIESYPRKKKTALKSAIEFFVQQR